MSCDHRTSHDHRTLCDHRTSHDHRDCVKEGIPLNYCSVSKNHCTIHFCHIIDLQCHVTSWKPDVQKGVGRLGLPDCLPFCSYPSGWPRCQPGAKERRKRHRAVVNQDSKDHYPRTAPALFPQTRSSLVLLYVLLPRDERLAHPAAVEMWVVQRNYLNTLNLVSMFANNALLGLGLGLVNKRKIKRRSKALLCHWWQTWTSLHLCTNLHVI